jgi:hypothetical protein
MAYEVASVGQQRGASRIVFLRTARFPGWWPDDINASGMMMHGT